MIPARSCQHCGHVIDARQPDGSVSRMGLIVNIDPPKVFLRHKPLPLPSPTELRFLYILVRWGEIASEELSRATRSEAVMPVTVQAHITHLRAWLEAQGVPVVIQSIKGHGYRLARPPTPPANPARIKQAFAEAQEVA